MPTLYMFAISHFCEKARWALDYCGIDYRIAHLAPGAHGRWAKKQGLNKTSVPILHTGDDYIQGSTAIISWADEHSTNGNNLTPATHREDALAIESRCDEIIGVHVRRMFYSEALVEYPETVKPIFLKDLPALQRMTTSMIWPMIRKMMMQRMDLGAAQGKESQRILEGELDWLDSLYADGRRFLCGDAFTRADLTVSSLLARTAGVPEHPAAQFMSLPPRTNEIAKVWQERQTLARIRDNYREFR